MDLLIIQMKYLISKLKISYSELKVNDASSTPNSQKSFKYLKVQKVPLNKL